MPPTAKYSNYHNPVQGLLLATIRNGPHLCRAAGLRGCDSVVPLD